MRSRTRFWISAALILLGTCLFVPGQTPSKTVKALPATITGKVTIKEKPAPGVVVTLRQSDFSNRSETLPRGTTDQEGVYKITGVPAGSYEVTPSAPAHVPAGGPNTRARVVVASDGENIENINFSLVKGGVITGKIVDADGRVVIAQVVNLYRADAFEQRPQQQQPQPRPNPIFQTASATTDDRGIYRMFGIPAGRYKVAVGRGEETFTNFSGVGRPPFKQVFHPDVSDQAKASIIDVSEGSETTGIDVTLGRPIQTFSVSGRVVDGEKGMPIPGIRFALQRLRSDRPEIVPNPAVSNSQGEFLVEGLISGKYSAFAMQEPNNELRVESVTFDVFEQDVTGLTIRMVRGGTITGVVALETENTSAASRLPGLQINAYVQNPSANSGLGMGSSTSLGPDGTFRLAGLSTGTAFLSISNTQGDQAKGFTVVRAERDGIVMPRGIEIKEGDQVTGVRLVVAYGNATLRGMVRVNNGTIPEGANLSVRLKRSGDQLSNTRPPRVDARGNFVIEGMAPGQYEISVALISPTLRSRRPTIQQVSLQDGVVTEIEIMLAELVSSGPQP